MSGSTHCEESPKSKNPKRVEAGRRNRQKAGPLTEAGRISLRMAAIANKPWLKSSGPKTAEGKARVTQNVARSKVPTEADLLLARFRAHAALLARLRQTRYLELHTASCRSTDQLASDLKHHFEEVFQTKVQRLAARLYEAT